MNNFYVGGTEYMILYHNGTFIIVDVEDYNNHINDIYHEGDFESCLEWSRQKQKRGELNV